MTLLCTAFATARLFPKFTPYELNALGGGLERVLFFVYGFSKLLLFEGLSALS